MSRYIVERRMGHGVFLSVSKSLEMTGFVMDLSCSIAKTCQISI